MATAHQPETTTAATKTRSTVATAAETSKLFAISHNSTTTTTVIKLFIVHKSFRRPSKENIVNYDSPEPPRCVYECVNVNEREDDRRESF